MKTILRWAVVVLMAAAARAYAADIPFTDGDMNVPGGTAQTEPKEQAKEAEELGGGAGEPGRKEEAAPRPRSETESEADLWTDRGGE